MRGLNLLALPHRGKVYQTKHKLRRRAEGRFHYTQVRQGWVCHYSSDEPLVARPEWLLDQLIASEVVTTDESVVVVEALEFDGSYLCMVVEQGVVTQTWQQTDTNWLSLQINSAERTLLLGAVPGLEGEVCQLDNQAANTLAQYQLKAPSRLGVGIAIATALLGLVFIAGSWQREAEPEPVVEPQPKDVPAEVLTVVEVLPPWVEYRLALLKAQGVEQSLQQAFYLATYLSMLPDGWKSSEVVFGHQSITTTLTREPKGLMSVMKAWLEQHPELARFVVTTGQDTYAVTLPVASGVRGWSDKSMPMTPSANNLQDALTLMGFTLSEATKVTEQETWQRLSWKVEKTDASLGELAYLNNLLASLPISVSELMFVHVSDDVWNAQFTMTFYGGL